MQVGAVFISMLAVLAMIQFMVQPGQAGVTCGQVGECLASCMPYLTAGGNPAAACCDGVRNLKGMTPTTVDRRAACNCVKEAAAHYQNIKDDAAAALPTKCGVQMNIPISRTTNCNAIS